MYPGPSPAQWTDWWKQANPNNGQYKASTNLFEQGNRLSQLQSQQQPQDWWGATVSLQAASKCCSPCSSPGACTSSWRRGRSRKLPRCVRTPRSAIDLWPSRTMMSGRLRTTRTWMPTVGLTEKVPNLGVGLTEKVPNLGVGLTEKVPHKTSQRRPRTRGSLLVASFACSAKGA